MQHFVDHIGRLAMRRRPTGRHAPALVDRHIDNDAAWLHQGQIFALDQAGALAPELHRANDQIGPLRLFANGMPIAEQHVDVGRHDVVEIASDPC